MFQSKIYLLNSSGNHFCYSCAKKVYRCAVYVYPSATVLHTFHCLAWWSWDIFLSSESSLPMNTNAELVCTIDRLYPVSPKCGPVCACSALPFLLNTAWLSYRLCIEMADNYFSFFSSFYLHPVMYLQHIIIYSFYLLLLIDIAMELVRFLQFLKRSWGSKMARKRDKAYVTAVPTFFFFY